MKLNPIPKKYWKCQGICDDCRKEITEWFNNFTKELQQPPKISRRIKQWLANNETLPLITKIEMVISLYNQELLGTKP